MKVFDLRDSQATLSFETWVLVQIPLILRCVCLQSCSWGFTFSWAKEPGYSMLAICSVDPKVDAVLPSIPLAPALIMEDLERMAVMGEGMIPRQWGFHWKARKTPSNEALRKPVVFFNFYCYWCVCMCECKHVCIFMWRCVHAMALVWRSENNFLDLVVSFNLEFLGLYLRSGLCRPSIYNS